MSALGAILLALACAAGGGILYLLRGTLKETGAVEERERQTYRKIEGLKHAQKAKDDTNALGDDAVRKRLSRWFRK